MNGAFANVKGGLVGELLQWTALFMADFNGSADLPVQGRIRRREFEYGGPDPVPSLVPDPVPGLVPGLIPDLAKRFGTSSSTISCVYLV